MSFKLYQVHNGLRGDPGVLALSRVVVAANHDQEPAQTQHQPMGNDPVLDRVQTHGFALHMLVVQVIFTVHGGSGVLATPDGIVVAEKEHDGEPVNVYNGSNIAVEEPGKPRNVAFHVLDNGLRLCWVDGHVLALSRVVVEANHDQINVYKSSTSQWNQISKIPDTLLENNTWFKARYDALITIHQRFFQSGIHTRTHFLTWHRWYMLQYENLLREVDCRFTIAYWDWSVVSGNPWGTTANDLWFSGNTGFGGNGVAPGRCVQTGPFRDAVWQLVPSAAPPRCLKRSFNGNPPDSVAVTQVLNIPSSNFNGFELAVRINLHNSVHCLIDATMCSLDSASAPEFFLHHGMIDKIWEDWQKKSNTHRSVFFSTLNTALPSTNNLLPRIFIDNAALPGGVRVEYEPVRNSMVVNVLQRLRAFSPAILQKIPREGFSPIGERSFDLFKVSAKERIEAKKIEATLQPAARSGPAPGASPVDKKLGFSHRLVDSINV
ncbi:hypothetical protein QZH41_002475 [Actinostola sp. cb2023]|nr:hypothetical protein QZH41_002475 [Actinostola sp. cb2023]